MNDRDGLEAGDDRSSAPSPWTREEVSLLELVNRTIDRGVVLHGEAILSVADVDLVALRLDLCLQAIDDEDEAAEG